MSVYRLKPKAGEEPHKWKVEKFDEQREDVNNAIMAILIDGLMPAFAELGKIRASDGKPLPMMDRRELYHDFCRKLWKAYKDLTQRAALVAGFNIGFLFTSDKDFAKGLKEFQATYPDVRPELGKSLEEARGRWQNELAKFRNTFLEHQDSDPKQFAKFYHPKYVESMSNRCSKRCGTPLLIWWRFCLRVDCRMALSSLCLT
jgi:hypothetical protein